MSGDLHQISAEIGGLNAKVDNLAELIRETREESRDEHRKVHDIVDALSEAVRGLADDVKEMKPLTDDYRETRAEGRGRKNLLTTVYLLVASGVGAVAGKLMEWISVLFSARGPHP